MRVICVMNLKGGVGKTTTVVNMAAIMAREHGLRVVVIDADPQANATDFFGVHGAPAGLASWFTEPIREEAETLVQPTAVDGVGVIRGGMELVDLDLAPNAPRRLNAIRSLTQSLSDFYAPDVVLIDCPPCFMTTSCAAILASEDVIIPVKPDGFVFAGAAELTSQISGLQKVNPYVRIAGALITFWHNSEAVVEGEKALRASGLLPVYKTVIRRTDKVDECTYARQTLDTWSPYSSAGRDYKAFVAEFLGV